MQEKLLDSEGCRLVGGTSSSFLNRFVWNCRPMIWFPDGWQKSCFDKQSMHCGSRLSPDTKPIFRSKKIKLHIFDGLFTSLDLLSSPWFRLWVVGADNLYR